MKKFSYLAIAGLCIAVSNPAFANKNFWKTYPSKVAPTLRPKQKLPSDYKIIQLDQESLKALLATAGSQPSSGVQITLPTPEGGFKTFNVWNTPVMEAELQRQYSEIQTYTGVSIDDGNVTVKMDYTPMGFQAKVYAYNIKDDYFIDPAGYDADGFYVLAFQKDFKSQQTKIGDCDPLSASTLTPGTPTTVVPEERNVRQRTTGNIRRTYRAAVACTGEYAQTVTGSTTPTVSQVLSIIASTINNANGVWEREVSISLKLINSNTSIIYTDGNLDPYTDNSKSAALGENQTNLTSVIGNANYDIGHVLASPPGAQGGVAALASACDVSSKAKGVSGSGGANDIGVIIHEVGHQLGAGHTFTAETDGCNGNGMANSAYEPGSGTTIMSYNGACGSNNTPAVSTDYYNQYNLLEIYNFTSSGGACGSTLTGQAPVILPNVSKRYIIPANTPFELIAPEATKTVATNAATTFCWEQFDKGPINMTEAQGSSVLAGPVFSSLDPDTSRVRVFPTYAKLAQNIYSDVGQRLPNITRLMNFKLTARSLAADGWGTHNTIDGVVQIKTVKGVGVSDFRVTAPSQSSIVWTPGQQYTISWNVSNTLLATDSIQCGFVNIYLSKDGGMTFPIILATNVENNGNFNITAPDLYTTQARVKVKSVGNIFFDVSKVNFKVNGNPSSVKGLDLSSSLNVYPNPATSQLNIKIDAYQGGTMQVIMLNTLGQRIWTGEMKETLDIPVGNMARGTYFLHVQDLKTGKYGVKNVVLK